MEIGGADQSKDVARLIMDDNNSCVLNVFFCKCLNLVTNNFGDVPLQ